MNEQKEPETNESKIRTEFVKQRDDAVYALSKVFNEQVVDEKEHYGYGLFSDWTKQSDQIDSYEKYKRWAKNMKAAFPQLGTRSVRILYGNRDQIDMVLVDGKIHFIIEMDETDGKYTINEIRSYAAKDLPDRKYDGKGCYLLFQEYSSKDKDCPHW